MYVGGSDSQAGEDQVETSQDVLFSITIKEEEWMFHGKKWPGFESPSGFDCCPAPF